MPGFKDDARYSKGRKAAKVIGLMMAGAALVGCNTAEARPVETTSQLPPEPEKPSAAETIGQDTEIPYEQLNIMEQTTPVDEMLQMSNEQLAQLSVPDRAALGYYIVKKNMREADQTYNVNPIDKDLVSFYAEPANNTRSGGLILAAITDQVSSLAVGTENDARCLAFATWYDVTKDNDIAPYVNETMSLYSQVVNTEGVEVIEPSAYSETGWLAVQDNGQTQWMKVINEVAGGEDHSLMNRTAQRLRVTVKTLEDETIFFYMQGRTSDIQDGEHLKEYAELPPSK